MKLKTTEDKTLQARQMGEEFAKQRGQGLLEIFLKDSNIAAEFYAKYVADLAPNQKPKSPDEHLDLLKIDFQFAFGQMVGLCYALGFIDALDDTRKDLYKKANLLDQREKKAAQPEVTKLIMPDGRE